MCPSRTVRNSALVPRRKIRDRSETLAWAIFTLRALILCGTRDVAWVQAKSAFINFVPAQIETIETCCFFWGTWRGGQCTRASPVAVEMGGGSEGRFICAIKKHVARNMLAPSAVAFMQHIPYARVRIHSGAFFV